MHDGRAGDEAHRPVVGEEVDALAVDEAAHRDSRLAEAPGEAAGDGIVAQGLEREGLVANAHGDAAPGQHISLYEHSSSQRGACVGDPQASH